MIAPLGTQVPRRGNWLSRWLARAFLRLSGWQLMGEIPNLPKMVLIGAPHTTNWDGVYGLATLMALGLRASTMIKDSAFKGPLGMLLRALGAIPVDRKSPKGVVEQSIDAFAARAQFLLLIAPEGTRDSADDWKRGYYRIAEGAGVPVLPAVIDYAAKLIRFGPPMVPTGDYDADFAQLLKFYREYGVARHPQRLSKPLLPHAANSDKTDQSRSS